MTDERIKVICYSGHRAEETPKTLFLDDREFPITEVLYRRTEEGLNDRTRRRFFKVRCSDNSIHEIYLDERSQEWHRRIR